MIVIGIDPGLTGALVAIDSKLPDVVLDHHKIVCVGESINIKSVVNFINNQIKTGQQVVVAVENPHVHQGDGISTVFAGFRYGYSVGTMQAIPQALGLNTTLVQPMQWKSHFNLVNSKISYQEKKDNSVNLAIKFTGCKDLFVDIKQQGKVLREIYKHDVAEAYLIARYHAEHNLINNQENK